MCVMAILYKATRDTPILLAANREESLDRPSQPPKIQSGSPRVICGIDREAGGTWLGVNQFGMLATVANRRISMRSPLAANGGQANPRSRGLLCRELLNFRTAREAAEHALAELNKGIYAGANYVVLDAEYGAVIYHGDRTGIIELTPGLHTLTNGDLNDPRDERQQFVRRALTLHKLDSSVTFLAVASRAFTRIPQPSMGLPRRTGGLGKTGSADPRFGTVSCSLVSLSNRSQQTVFQHAPGAPDKTPLDDLSALLRQVLSTERSRRRAQEERERKQREKAEAEKSDKPDKTTSKKPTDKKAAPEKKAAKASSKAKSADTKKKPSRKAAPKSAKPKKKAAKKATAKKASTKKAAPNKTTKKAATKKKSTKAKKTTATKKARTSKAAAGSKKKRSAARKKK